MSTITSYGEITLTDLREPFVVLLSNEVQQFVTDVNRKASVAQSFYTDVKVFQGNIERTDYIIGTITNANNITVAKTSSRITFSVSSGTVIGADSGTFTIPITLDNNTINKTFSWSCSKQGSVGATGKAGADAKSVQINSSTQYFKSVNGGALYTPDTITLTPIFQGGITYLKWQYSLDGGSTWMDVNGSTNGVSVSTGVLTLKNASTLFTDKISSIPFKCLSDNTSYYDVMTIAKLYDPEDVEIGGRNLLLNSQTLFDYMIMEFLIDESSNILIDENGNQLYI